MLGALLAEEEQALEVDRHDLVVVLLGDFHDGLADVHTGVVEEDVDFATLFDDAVDGGLHCVEIGHVHFDGEGLTPGGFDGGDGFVQLAAGAGGANDGGARSAHAFGDAAADTAAGAGHDGDLVVESQRWMLSRSALR